MKGWQNSHSARVARVAFAWKQGRRSGILGRSLITGKIVSSSTPSKQPTAHAGDDNAEAVVSKFPAAPSPSGAGQSHSEIRTR